MPNSAHEYQTLNALSVGERGSGHVQHVTSEEARTASIDLVKGKIHSAKSMINPTFNPLYCTVDRLLGGVPREQKVLKGHLL